MLELIKVDIKQVKDNYFWTFSLIDQYDENRRYILSKYEMAVLVPIFYFHSSFYQIMSLLVGGGLIPTELFLSFNLLKLNSIVLFISSM